MNPINIIDLQTIIRVARGLKELREQVVFVGGAVLGFYADDLAAEELRPTRDGFFCNPDFAPFGNTPIGMKYLPATSARSKQTSGWG